MSRAIYVTSILLFGLGGAIFAYKNLVLDMPIRLDRNARVWRIELAISTRGENRSGRVELQIPRSDARQVLLDEQSYDDGLDFSITESDAERRAVWRGSVGEGHRLAYTFRVHLPTRGEHITRNADPLDSEPAPRGATHIPPIFLETLERLRIEPGEEPASIIAKAFGFVAHDIETAPGGSDDARLALRAREASAIGQARLLVELLQTAGVEARFAQGIHLPSSGRTEITPFVEAVSNHGWIPLFTDTTGPGVRPANFIVLSRSPRPLLSTTGVNAAHLDVTVLRESLPPTELASFVSPDSEFWRALSFYRLPLDTQETLQVLLVIPLASLIASIFRNLIGFRTFGTFMPILIALSLRRTDLASGLMLVAGVLMAGVLGRLALDRLRLLFVPRICLLLCLVVLCVTGLAQIGYEVQGRGFMSGLLFPIVILAMLIERISVTTLEEGFESTAKLLGASLLLSALVYPVFQSDWISHLFFGFPELIFCVMAILVLIGGYTGYRIAELWRFRTFAALQGKDA
jgi:hypothetical protein